MTAPSSRASCVRPIVDGLRVIREGLGAKDRIIINGLVRARPGAKVTPQPGQIEPGAS